VRAATTLARLTATEARALATAAWF